MNIQFSNNHHLLVEYENKLYARDPAINEAICAAILDGIKEEKSKGMNIEYNNKNECRYIDIDFGEAFSVPNNYNLYIKIRDSYTSKDDCIRFNAIELNTGARCFFPDSEKVLRYKNAKVVIDVEG